MTTHTPQECNDGGCLLLEAMAERDAIAEKIAVAIEGMALGQSVEIMGARMDWRPFAAEQVRKNAAAIARKAGRDE